MKEIFDGTKETNSHWSWKSGKPVVCVDFHHTITTHCEACPAFSGYKLQEGVKEALQLLKEDFRIFIYTGNPEGNEWISNPDEYKNKLILFLEYNHIPFDKILFTKPPSIFIIDDRAIHHTSWKETLHQIVKRRNDESAVNRS